jgi:uncharacterized protein YdiU (UPF0061 family)
VDFTVARDFPHLAAVADDGERRAAWLAEVCERTARLMVHWMRVGFVHGVMNTDNMSVLGVTIDYGPYGWLDDFDPHWTPNTTDRQGRRYRYAQQPAVAQWNLVRLAEALLPLFPGPEPLERALDRYDAGVHGRLRGDGGGEVRRPAARAADADVQALTREGYELLQQGEVDHTLFFRALGELAEVPADDEAALAALGDVFYDAAKRDAGREALAAWLRRWHAAVSAGGEPFEARRARMHAVNPRYVLRQLPRPAGHRRGRGGDASLVGTRCST